MQIRRQWPICWFLLGFYCVFKEPCEAHLSATCHQGAILSPAEDPFRGKNTMCFCNDFQCLRWQKNESNFHDLPCFVQPNWLSLYPNLALFPSFGIFGNNFIHFLLQRHAEVDASFELMGRPLGRNWPNYIGFISIFERPCLGHLGGTLQGVMRSGHLRFAQHTLFATPLQWF